MLGMGPDGYALMRRNDKAKERRDLRDQFAMAALTALGHTFSHGGWNNPNEYQVKAMAMGAYQVADAMLAAREAG